MQNFCLFCKKNLLFPILHTHFYKTPTSVCLLYHLFYLNNHFPHFFIIYLNSLSLSPFTVTSNNSSTDPPQLKLADPQAPIHHDWNSPIHKHRSATSTDPQRFVPVGPNISISSTSTKTHSSWLLSTNPQP